MGSMLDVLRRVTQEVNAAKDFMAGRQLYGKNFDIDKLGDPQLEVKDCVIDNE